MHVTLPGHELHAGAEADPTRCCHIDAGRRRAAGHRQAGPARPAQGRHRAHRPADRGEGREGHRRRPRSTSWARRLRKPWSSPRTPTVSVEAEATHMPESVEVSIEGLEVGTQIHAERPRPPGRHQRWPSTRIAHRQHHRRAHRRPRSRPNWQRPKPRPASSTMRRRPRPRAKAPKAALSPPRATARRLRPRRKAPRASDLVGRRAGQPRPDVRQHPSQRRLSGRRRPGRTHRRHLQSARLQAGRRRRRTACRPARRCSAARART